ncbi:MAG: FKBP-type peptidyl-prolyl cis-trans isomerase [Bacteroidales bacterium]|nr:FKBP-type peptidyl-prolyl cis-trans isomerase [Bacteroidales bacterium]MBO7462840.1 FKBP-type peptidyl-prolyl cis-trans isomerase [Bacteroidales bacterium]MBO7566646.1 FKBP-type peptidyl-prolyl cis-trans isomerase [Bacteroidales bacterium]MBP5682497.1 FKBP-type peptidyl-prolyl cis-trans isomerase [Bacteroidales bacterium]
MSYAMGVLLGMDMRESIQQRFEPAMEGFNYDNFLNAFYTVLKDSASLKMDPKSANDYFNNAMQVIQAKQQAIEQAKRDSIAAVNLEAGKKFLEENAKKDGVKTLPSGIQYIVLEEGKGAKPTIDDQVECDYEGSLIDGTVFDSSIKRGEPATFPLKNVIKGWQEAIPMMPLGSKWKIFIPAELGYGEQGSYTIPGNSVLIFDVKLLQIIKPEKKK